MASKFRPRKTVEVATVATMLQRAIDNLRTDTHSTVHGERRALCFALGDILHMSNNYHGFMYRNGYRPGEGDFDEYDRVYIGVSQ